MPLPPGGQGNVGRVVRWNERVSTFFRGMYSFRFFRLMGWELGARIYSSPTILPKHWAAQHLWFDLKYWLWQHAHGWQDWGEGTTSLPDNVMVMGCHGRHLAVLNIETCYRISHFEVKPEGCRQCYFVLVFSGFLTLLAQFGFLRLCRTRLQTSWRGKQWACGLRGSPKMSHGQVPAFAV